eukprot:CAMPEP_0196815552 /NCGR_PEP_ID=MMETSP1362-20130617/50470_1 /TAXON_ID=163516 /ORGANISM="Leptocylindrus danicus, Strain CCMP1856" /LENGTH=900 /DNA_ID=CAMNT_0042192547 /DNA_START=112 /DNA_END=2814 /DNA_ORIENTATION=+
MGASRGTPARTGKKNTNLCMSFQQEKATRPTVLVGVSGAGKELSRLANSVIEMTSGLTSAELSLLQTQPDGDNGVDIDCGVLEPVGKDEMGLWTYDTEIFDELLEEGKIGENDVILLDFGNDYFDMEEGKFSESFEEKYLDLLEHLYNINCPVVFVNVHPEASFMSPRSAATAKRIEEDLIEFSHYEIAIYDEGLSSPTILARDALNSGIDNIKSGESGSNKKTLPINRNVDSFDDITNALELNPEDSPEHAAKINQQIKNWNDIEWDLKRLLKLVRKPARAVGDAMNKLDFGVDAFFLSLTFSDVRLSKEYLPNFTPDNDAMEFRADLINIVEVINREKVSAEGVIDVNSAECSESEKRFHMLRQVGLIRRMCRPYATRAPALETILDAIPLVYTVRTAHQAGTWPDDKEGIGKMFELLMLGLRSGVEVLDVESAWDKDLTKDLLDEAEEIYGSTMILGSHHVVTDEVEDQEAIQLFKNCALDGRAHGLKVVLSTSNPENASQAERCRKIAIAQLKEEYGARKGDIPAIGLVLGETGQESRILNRHYTPVTHESLPFVAAPGQLSSNEIMKRRVVEGITPKKEYTILGHNIAYSVSPEMHNSAFATCGLPHEYGRSDHENVDEFVATGILRRPSFGGASVTIPHKQNIMSHLQKITESAKEIGAVNTILVDDSGDERILTGDNTDWIGIYEPVKRCLRSDEGGVALILGAGGTARAAAYAAKKLNLIPIYYNRTPAKAQELADLFGGKVLSEISEETLESVVQEHGEIRAVISTLPAAAEFEFDEWFFTKTLKECSSKPVVLDVNYKPYNTPLLIQCQAKGCRIVRGSEMLWEQGVQQFERWFERRAPYKVMKDVVLKNCFPKIEEEDDDESSESDNDVVSVLKQDKVVGEAANATQTA